MILREIKEIMTNAETITRIAELIEYEEGMTWAIAEGYALQIQRLSDEILSITEKEYEKKRL